MPKIMDCGVEQSILYFIIFIIKSMKNTFQRGYNDQQYKIKNNNFNEISAKNRFALNLPDCSLVFQTNNNNHLDTNEMSWLQKLPSDHYDQSNSNILCDSDLNQESKNSNQMKFSFNMNYNILNDDQYRDQNHHFHKLESENKNNNQKSHQINKKQSYQKANKKINIQNSIQIRRNIPGNEKSIGSIKKNRQSRVELQEFSESIFQTADNITVNKLQQMNKKLNIALSRQKYKSDGKALKQLDIDLNYNILDQKLQPKSNRIKNNLLETNENVDFCSKYDKKHHKTARQLNSMKQQQSEQTIKYLIQKNVAKYPKITEDVDGPLESLFQILDKAKIGKLNKNNCCLENIQEEFKFIFGDIFTKIKLKQFECNKKQFISYAKKIISQISSQQIIDLLQKINPPPKTKQNMIIQQQFLPKTIRNEHKIENNRKVERRPSSLCILQPDCYSLKQTLKFNNIKQDKICQCGAIIYQNKQEKENYVSRQQKGYRTHSKKLQESKGQLKSKGKQNMFFYDESFKSNKYSTQVKKKLPLQKQNFKYKPGGINKQILKQHKKSLEQINNLNRKIQLCLRNQTNTQSSCINMNQSSLYFSQLVKHI